MDNTSNCSMMFCWIVVFIIIFILYQCSLIYPGVERGLSFIRQIDEVPGSFDLVFDGHHCTQVDGHGDNECHYLWGEDITGKYKLTVDRDIDEGDSMTGHFKVRSPSKLMFFMAFHFKSQPPPPQSHLSQIDRFIPYSFTCALCGEDCILTIPVVKFTYTIPLPACPVPAHTIETRIEYKLQSNSPTEGIPTHLEGAIEISKSSGEKIAAFTVSIFVA
jgi:hypothetical protein